MLRVACSVLRVACCVFHVYVCTCVRVYLCTCIRFFGFRAGGHELREHPGEEQAEQSRPEGGAGEKRQREEDSGETRLAAKPKSCREQGGGHREDGSPRLPRERNEGRVNGEEEGEDQRGARPDLLTKNEWNKHERAARQRGPEARQEVETAKDEKQNGGEVGVRDVGTERGAVSLRDLQGIQREPRLGIRQREFAEAHKAQSEGEQEGEQI